MSGGWGTPRRGDIDEGPPSNDPERPTVGRESVSSAPHSECAHCCVNCKCHEQENTDDR